MKIIYRLLFVLLAINLYSCGYASQKQNDGSNIALKQNISSEMADVIVSEVQTKPLNNEEIKILKKICMQYTEIKLTSTVLSSNDKQSDVQILYYEKDSSNFYFGEYVEYSVSLKNETVIFKLDYTYSVGQAFSAIGQISYNKITHDMIKSEYNYGTGGGSSEIDVNGKIIFEKSNGF